MAVDHMEALLEVLQARAKYNVSDAVYWRGTVYHVTARYYRRSRDEMVYDLEEIVPPKKTGRLQKRVSEADLELWAKEKQCS